MAPSSGLPTVGLVSCVGLDQSVEHVVVRRNALEYHYPQSTVSALVRAAQFGARIRSIDEQLASRAIRHPRETAAAVASRADIVGSVAEDVGFVSLPALDERLPSRGLTIGNALIDPNRPAGVSLRTAVQLPTGSVARVYETDGRPCYALEPAGFSLDENDRELLDRGSEAIATGSAVDPVDALAGEPGLVSILEKYTTGYGILEDCFADPAVSDVFVTAPVGSNPLRIVRDGSR
ncbi:MAG: hypothetical protein U5K37_08085 [Natrialbaceae archaeon]|nr:hypothetical protein [Natrialbaceae archaeon]